MNALRQSFAAIAIAIAGHALAQAPAPAPAQGAWPSAKQQRDASRPAQAAQPAQPAQPNARLSEEQLQALGQVWMLSQQHVALGDLAKARKASPEVQKYAQDIETGHKSFQPYLASLLRERGVDPSSLPQPPERQQLDQEMKQVASLSGPEFDGALIGFMKRNGEAYVNALKRAREATPGQDPTLKKALDGAEDSEETYLTAARQLDARRVQARTPPSR